VWQVTRYVTDSICCDAITSSLDSYRGCLLILCYGHRNDDNTIGWTTNCRTGIPSKNGEKIFCQLLYVFNLKLFQFQLLGKLFQFTYIQMFWYNRFKNLFFYFRVQLYLIATIRYTIMVRMKPSTNSTFQIDIEIEPRNINITKCIYIFSFFKTVPNFAIISNWISLKNFWKWRVADYFTARFIMPITNL